jgi:hypothetical protein
MQLPLAQVPEKGPTTLDLMYAAISCISARGCFQDIGDMYCKKKSLATCYK